MRKSPVLIVLIICSLCIGSKETVSINHNYKFYGEGTHWKATLNFIGRGSASSHYDEHQKDFVLEYKGEYSEISNSIVNYSYKSSGGEEGGFESPPGTKYIRTNEEGNGGDIQRKKEVIKVIVKWNGKEEIIPMKIQNDK
ncbi:hypothetical protein [Peribacillus frigoritolerans]|uniref:hypothetical protein n=1 Tax=Peribacillus frigoritolerans TaxID=450367 RepID=UPI001071149F|nr:hypothetical protein [Peribacillus frigoritolerans]TFH58268.1 hypothetical protein E4J71_25430 [Peribacillus frigoritolerans]